MANSCYFQMKIVGPAKTRENVKTIMLNKDSLYRIAAQDVQIIDDSEDEDTMEITLDGDCRWSIKSSMRSEIDAGEHKFLTLRDLSKKFELQIEAISEEPGFEFMEHYIVNNGIEEMDECIDTSWHHFEPSEMTFDEFLDENGLSPEEYSESDLDDNNDIKVGGIEYDFVI